MSHYYLEIVGNTLKVDFGDTLTSGQILVQDVESQLEVLIKNKQFSGGVLLKIYGRISVLLSYTIAHKVAHLYQAIAVSDTRLGAYVVVMSTNTNYMVGSRIDFETGEVKQVFPDIIPEETAFLLEWQDGILQAKLNRNIQVDGDIIVREIAKKLDYFCESNQLKGGKLLKINGRTSVLASFIMANYLAHLYSAIAVHDPKIGTHEEDKYVVVISHDPDYPVGTNIDVPNQALSNIKVVLCGAANVGKTCLREGLRQALQQLPQAPDSYVISGCPDGDGAWFSQTAQKYPELAKELKHKYKASFTPEFAQAKAREITVIKTPILVFDVGGKISRENEVIMTQATHSVILAKTEAEVQQWQEFCQALKLPIIAIIMSDYEGTEDKILKTYPPLLEGTIHHLDRHQNVTQRPTIQALAQLLSDLTIQLRNKDEI
jgi:CRISPR-associated protein Csx3